MTDVVLRAIHEKSRQSLGITDSFQDHQPVKTAPDILLDPMEEFAMQGDDASAKECLTEFMRLRGKV